MDIDIDNINTFENRNKLNTVKWRPIYEVIDEAYIINSKMFQDDFMQKFTSQWQCNKYCMHTL